MKPKTLVLLAVAGSCGLFAMLGVQQAMQGTQAAPEVEMKKVLVAIEGIDTGVKLNDLNVEFVEKPADSVPEDAITKVEDYLDRAARVPLMQGDIVRLAKLTEPGEFGKSVEIPHGMRVLTIPVDDSHTNSGMVKPGDRVDVLVTYQGRGDRGGQVSKTKMLLEYVEIFATDDTTQTKLNEKKDSSHARFVSLLLTPEQVNYVVLAQRKGTFSLSWRRRGDDEIVQTKELDEALLEELEGTVGLNDQRPLYGRGFDDEFVMGPDDIRHEPSPPPENNVSQFLNAQQGVPAPAPVVESLPPRPTWKIEILGSGSATTHEFELPEEPETASIESQKAVDDAMKSVLGGDVSLENIRGLFGVK